MNWKDLSLSGWGRTSAASVLACRPERDSELARALGEAPQDSILAVGAARSYGDAALNSGGRALLTERLNRLIAFDAETGDLVCEPGVTFNELLRVFAPRGFLVPASPGTGFCTVGGAVANDVHGKNHDNSGSFGDHVNWIDLVLGNGEALRVSPQSHADLFSATIGGLGLTGIIAAVSFRMKKTAATAVQVRERRIPDLDAFLAALQESRDTATYSVGWIDALARGRHFGRGILETAEPSDETRTLGTRKPKTIPLDLPGLALNPLSVAAFNELYFRRVPAAGRDRVLAIDRFFYPLDSLLQWNRLYGKRGFYQFQCVLPDAEAPSGLRRLLEEIAGARAASFLAVLKTLGGPGRGHLSFPMRGATLALDFPRRGGTEDLLSRLERITLDHNGRIYLAKDAVLSPDGFARMYPRLDEFRGVLAQIGGSDRLQSDMARRLGIRT